MAKEMVDGSQRHANPRLAVVIVNWNNAPDTLACLMSLRRHAPEATVIVIDNASTDGSDREIAAAELADVLIRTSRNLGFAGATNIGLQRAIDMRVANVMVLNNDTIVTAGMIDRLLGTLMAGPRRAISPRIVYDSEPQVAWFAGGIIDRGWPRHLQPDEVPVGPPGVRPTEFLTGCCILARRSDWTVAGQFDEDYFLIFEDSDWSLRARQKGLSLWVDDHAILRHKVSQSFRRGPAAMLGAYYFARNGVLFHMRWQRHEVARFVAQKAVLPFGRALRLREDRASAGFALSGVCAAFLHRRGAAGSLVTLVARWLSR